MEKIRYFLTGVCLVILFCCGPVFAQNNEEITITTYYPSPNGSYNQLETSFLNFREQASLPDCAAQNDGQMIFHRGRMKYCHNHDWVIMMGQAVELCQSSVLISDVIWGPSAVDPNPILTTTCATKLGFYQVDWSGTIGVALDATMPAGDPDRDYFYYKVTFDGVKIGEGSVYSNPDSTPPGGYLETPIEGGFLWNVRSKGNKTVKIVVERKGKAGKFATATFKTGMKITTSSLEPLDQ